MGIQPVEDFLIPHLRLLIRGKRIEIDQVDSIRQSTRITVSLYFMQFKELRNLDCNIPFRLMQSMENILSSGTEHFSVIQALDHVCTKRIKLNRTVMYFPLAGLSIQQSQKGIKSGTETYFQNGDFPPFQMVQPGFDKDMARLLYGAVHRMVVFVHFWDKKRMATIRRQL